MTPFELSLRHELDLEQHRFGNEWLFRWHNLNIEGKTVDVDKFDGGRITLGGCRFESQQQDIYWQAIGRYLNGKVHTSFRKWNEETKPYPTDQRRSSLDGTSRLLGDFVAGIVKRATETDQAVRGRGHPKADVPGQSSATYVQTKAEILGLTEAHKALMDGAEKGERSITTAVTNIGLASSNSTMAGAFNASTFGSSRGNSFRSHSLHRAPTSLTPDELCLQLRDLVIQMPELATGPLTPEINNWLARACLFVEMTGDVQSAVKIKIAFENLTSILRSNNAQTIVAIVHQALARAEMNASARTQGNVVGIAARTSEFRDIFVSHASEDKDEVARPLVEKLRAQGITVWFDEYELKLGDSLRRTIDQGLRQSRHGLVVMSKHFFNKPWPQKELDALFALESEERRLMPVWHNLTEQEVKQFAPLIFDRLAVSTTKGLDFVVNQILRALTS